jgi:hypothetical protein
MLVEQETENTSQLLKLVRRHQVKWGVTKAQRINEGKRGSQAGYLYFQNRRDFASAVI